MFTLCLGAFSSFCFSLAAEESELLTGRNLAGSPLQLFLEPTMMLTAGWASVLGRMSDVGQVRPKAVGAV